MPPLHFVTDYTLLIPECANTYYYANIIYTQCLQTRGLTRPTVPNYTLYIVRFVVGEKEEREKTIANYCNTYGHVPYF